MSILTADFISRSSGASLTLPMSPRTPFAPAVFFERLELATAIWESIVSEPESLPLTEGQRREVLFRSEAHRKNPEDAIPVEESLERIRRSL